MLKVAGVSKKIKNTQILQDVSLTIEAGEIVGLLGENGAGKTTLMRVILGLVSANEGEVWVNGQSLHKNFEETLSNLGGIIENPDFYPNLTGFQNLMYYSRIFGQKHAKESIEDLFSKVGLEGSSHKKVAQYSLGMRQRLGIAQAILNEPKLLILDEPMNGLDPSGIKELRLLLQELAKGRGISILISSHLISEVELLCDRVLVMKSGKIEHQLAVDKNAAIEKYDTVKVQAKVDDSVAAAIVLTDELSFDVLEINNQDNSIIISMKYAEIPKLLTDLLQRGVKIYEISKLSESLESKFFNVIGEDLR